MKIWSSALASFLFFGISFPLCRSLVDHLALLSCFHAHDGNLGCVTQTLTVLWLIRDHSCCCSHRRSQLLAACSLLEVALQNQLDPYLAIKRDVHLSLLPVTSATA